MPAIFCGTTTAALRLRHLPAFAVDGEPVRQQRPGRNAVSMHDVSSDEWNQPRCWSDPSRYRSAGKPVSADASRRSSGGRRGRPSPSGASCPNRTTRRACRSACDNVSRRRRSPRSSPRTSFDSACLDLRRRKLRQRQRVGVQRFGLAIDEERQRSLALPRQRPVGTIGDHPVQPRLAPFRKELRRVDAAQRRGAQRLGGLRAVESGTSSIPANHCVVAR